MSAILQVFICIPLAGYLLSLVLPGNREALISWTARIAVGLQLHLAVAFTLYWLFAGRPTLDAREFVLYEDAHYSFFLDFYFDKIAATYLVIGAVLTFLVAIYSRAYLHREKGYRRYFSTILFFYTGYNLTILAGNMETLFLGWEILGISSFLLIAFYRHRYLPVKNAVKIFSVYRMGDVGILLAMWMSHHLWHENITFLKLNNYELVDAQLQSHSWVGVFISMMILFSAAAKSAQLPFSSWLPRAMEGPTPSSAIFYGALSVHIGVFLLLRTAPFWEHQPSVRTVIAVLGLASSLVASSIARVQSSVKSQIAYGSIAQIGLIFIEIALGFKDLALFHFAGNACLRTYQLLVSPSVVTYLIREQFYTFSPSKSSLEDLLPPRLRYSLYMLNIKEWNLDGFMYRYLWNPLKWVGKKLDFLSIRKVVVFFSVAYLIGILALVFRSRLPAFIHEFLPVFFAFLGLVVVLKSFTERRKVRMSWLLIVLNHFWIALAISSNERFTFIHILLYLSGVSVAAVAGYACLYWLKKNNGVLNMNRFHGLSYEYPRAAFLFLLCCLGLTGFPLTPTFIGEDLIFSHIHEDQLLLATFISLSFILDGLATMRIYARVFLGPHAKTYHEIAYRSS
ncbi:MAG: hypothetical protein EAZ89_05690 [Bacteroidetes bacterium]|nr:MAG: hypothetical protein EAZ89_05690 [Bacteroidota bacterium]